VCDGGRLNLQSQSLSIALTNTVGVSAVHLRCRNVEVSENRISRLQSSSIALPFTYTIGVSEDRRQQRQYSLPKPAKLVNEPKSTPAFRTAPTFARKEAQTRGAKCPTH
jgi:hypothetical protein